MLQHLGRGVKAKSILLVAILLGMSNCQSTIQFFKSNERLEAPADDASWLYHNSSSAYIFEVHDGEIILNGDEFSVLNSSGYHLIDSDPGGSVTGDGSTGCDVATFHLNGSWFKLKGTNLYIHNGTGWEFRSTNSNGADYLNCYQQFMRIDYNTNQFTIASWAAKDGANYDQQNCKYSSYFSSFDSNGSHISTVEHFFSYGYMQTTSNGRCQAEVHSSDQGDSNRQIILKSNTSLVYGSEVDAENTADYILTFASNNTEAYRLENVQNLGYREGVNYFRNESGEHIVFRSFSAGGSSLIVSLHPNSTISSRTIPDIFPSNDDCIQTETSNGLFGIPTYIQCENGDIIDIENQSYHNYGSSTPTIIDGLEDMPEIGLRSGSIITLDSDDDGVEHFSDECPYTAANEEVDQYGCSDDQYVDRWIKIELKSWEADQSEYWDSNEGLPDPHFHVIIDIDGDEFATYTSPTWEDTWTLGHVWNLSIDIPNGARIIDIEIQCEDNDALNDDECEMNSEDGEWKLYYQFDVSGPSVVDFSGDGTTDNDTSWREASSNWTISYLTYDEIDSDDDGVINRFDECPGYDDNIDVDLDEIPDGCDDFIDSDGDGISDDEDQCPGHDDTVDLDSDGIIDGCDDLVDSDGDGTADEDDLCPNTPLGAIVDYGCPLDEDEDGVYDGLDDCPNSVGDVDANGCDLDSDSDGIPDWDDLCPNTPEGEEINVNDYNYWGCSSSQIDSDMDGVHDGLDNCPNSVGDVDSNGCDLDSDSDGIPDWDDLCPNTPLGAIVDYGCPLDEDEDGVYDGLDDCPNSVGDVDANGCDLDSDYDGVIDRFDECPGYDDSIDADSDEIPDDCDDFIDSDGDGCIDEWGDPDEDCDGVSDDWDDCPSTALGAEVDYKGCSISNDSIDENMASEAEDVNNLGEALMAIIISSGLVFVMFLVLTKINWSEFLKPKMPMLPVQKINQNVVQEQFVTAPPISSRELQLENQSRQAQFEAQRLRQELANQAKITQQLQMEAAQKQMSDTALAQKQHELTIAQREKEELEAKLAEAEKNTPIVQNITYNIQDSAISGDITNKIK